MNKYNKILNEISERYSRCYNTEDYLEMLKDIEKKYNCKVDTLTWSIKFN